MVLGKWMYVEPGVLILDRPTRGIDIGAKFEIYTIIAELAAQGEEHRHDLLRDARVAWHVRPGSTSSNEGRFVAEFDGDEATPET